MWSGAKWPDRQRLREGEKREGGREGGNGFRESSRKLCGAGRARERKYKL